MVGCLRTVMMAAAVLAAVPAAARPVLDPQRLEQLARYEVLLQSEPAGPGLLRHRAVGVFDAQSEDVFRVATCYDRYAEYMPRVTASHTLSQGPDESVVLLEADLPWPMADSWVHARFVHEQTEAGSYRVRFSMLRGNLHRYEGLLLIEPFGDGRSFVTYEIVAQPDSRIPRTWLQAAVGRGAMNFVHYLRSHVNQVLQKGLLHGPMGASLYPLHLKAKPPEPEPEDEERAP